MLSSLGTKLIMGPSAHRVTIEQIGERDATYCQSLALFTEIMRQSHTFTQFTCVSFQQGIREFLTESYLNGPQRAYSQPNAEYKSRKIILCFSGHRRLFDQPTCRHGGVSSVQTGCVQDWELDLDLKEFKMMLF